MASAGRTRLSSSAPTPAPPPHKDAASLCRAQGTADGQLGLPLDSDAVSSPASHPATKKVCLSSITHSEIAVLVQETPRASSSRTRPGPRHACATRLSPPHVPDTDAAHVQLCPLYRGDLIELARHHCLLCTQGNSVSEFTGTFQVIWPNPLPPQWRPGAQRRGCICPRSPG